MVVESLTLSLCCILVIKYVAASFFRYVSKLAQISFFTNNLFCFIVTYIISSIIFIQSLPRAKSAQQMLTLPKIDDEEICELFSPIVCVTKDLFMFAPKNVRLLLRYVAAIVKFRFPILPNRRGIFRAKITKGTLFIPLSGINACRCLANKKP